MEIHEGSMLFDTKGRLRVSEMTFASPHKRISSRLRIVAIYIKARSGGPDEMIAGAVNQMPIIVIDCHLTVNKRQYNRVSETLSFLTIWSINTVMFGYKNGRRE